MAQKVLLFVIIAVVVAVLMRCRRSRSALGVVGCSEHEKMIADAKECEDEGVSDHPKCAGSYNAVSYRQHWKECLRDPSLECNDWAEEMAKC